MQWLHKYLVESPIKYGLCLSEEEFNKQLNRLKVSAEERGEFLKFSHASATTHFFKNEMHNTIAIVTLNDCSNRHIEITNALLVHEAVHIWQEIKRLLGETEPSSEFEAYSIQGISQNLMFSFSEQSKLRKK